MMNFPFFSLQTPVTASARGRANTKRGLGFGLKRTAWLPLLLAFQAFSFTAFAQNDGDHQYTSDQIQTGSRVYTRNCALCHGPQGDVVDGIDLRLGQFRTAQTDADLMDVISNGAGGGQMPPFTLTDDQMTGIIAYIRAGFDPSGEVVAVGDPGNGRNLFIGKGQCASCHRVRGVGPRMAPELSDIGSIRTPAALKRSLVNPVAALFPINRPLRIVTLAEETITGRRLNEDTYSVQLVDSNEQLRSILKTDIATYELSAEPTHADVPALSTLNEEEVADLIGYLLTLRGLQ